MKVRDCTGSVLMEMGATRVLCTASIEAEQPKWRRESDLGWVTAEYSMLPGATPESVAGRDEAEHLVGIGVGLPERRDLHDLSSGCLGAREVEGLTELAAAG